MQASRVQATRVFLLCVAPLGQMLLRYSLCFRRLASYLQSPSDHPTEQLTLSSTSPRSARLPEGSRSINRGTRAWSVRRTRRMQRDTRYEHRARASWTSRCLSPSWTTILFEPHVTETRSRHSRRSSIA